MLIDSVNSRPINIMYTNINSLRNKIPDLEWEMNQSYGVDILALTETLLGPEINTGEVSINGYQLYRNDRSTQGGGVASYIRNDFNVTIINVQSSSECLFLKIKNNFSTFFLLTVYRPPNNSDPLLIPSLFEEASRLINLGTDQLIICGDFNFPMINWLTYTTAGNYKLCNPFLHKILELALEQHIFSSTHNLGNTLDLVFSNKSIVKFVEVSEPLISDHSIIRIKLSLSCPPTPIDNEYKIYQYNKANMEKAQSSFEQYEAEIKENIENKRNINDIYNLFVQGLIKIRNECVPSRTIKKSNQPNWFSNRIKNALKKQKSFYNAAKVCNSEYNANRYKTTRKFNKRLIKQAKKSHLAKTLYKPLQTGDSKPFYKHVRQCKENSSNAIPYLHYNNETAETASDKADMLNCFFESVFTTDDGLLPHLASKTVLNEYEEIVVTSEGVLKLLQGLKVSKSCGPDNVTGILLKTFADCVTASLTNIFSYSLDTGLLPDVWKKAKVIAIHKKGSRHSPNNYRPISLTSIVCKLLEHIVSSHINQYLQQNDLLVDAQHGFRKGRSCESQLVHTINDFAFNIEKNIVTDVIILDFSKAFDSVSHTKLLHKLRNFGIGDRLILWIKGFLQDRSQFVQLEDAKSNFCGVLSGVPQGSVLGPLLFLMYVNDLPNTLLSECRLFADDALLYNTRANQIILQNDLHRLEGWAKSWQLSFNTSKCSVLSIKDSSLKQCYYLHNNRIKNVNSHPYLGIELNHDLKWNRHINIIVAKASRTLGMLWRVLKTADTRTRQLAYNALVRPILEYGCSAWDPYLAKDIRQLEKVQNRAIRFIFRLKGHVSISQIREDTNIKSLKDRRKNLRLNFFVNSVASGVTTDKHADSPKQIHRTRQRKGLYVPAIKTKAYFNSFWPRTKRDIRDGF